MAYKPGFYRCEIGRQYFSQSAEKKTPFFCVEVFPFEVRVGDKWEHIEGFSVEVKIWMTPKGMARACKALRVMGFTGTDFSELEPGDDGNGCLKGRFIECECTNRDYNGRTYDQFEVVIDGVKPVPMKGVASSLQEKFNDELKAAAVIVPEEPVGEIPPRGAAAPKDEIPF